MEADDVWILRYKKSTDSDINIEVQINPEQETVWLTQKQMGELFNVKQATLSEHIGSCRCD